MEPPLDITKKFTSWQRAQSKAPETLKLSGDNGTDSIVATAHGSLASPGLAEREGSADRDAPEASPARKRLKSPQATSVDTARGRSPSPPRRSKARHERKSSNNVYEPREDDARSGSDDTDFVGRAPQRPGALYDHKQGGPNPPPASPRYLGEGWKNRQWPRRDQPRLNNDSSLARPTLEDNGPASPQQQEAGQDAPGVLRLDKLEDPSSNPAESAPGRDSSHTPENDDLMDLGDAEVLFRQPETRPISQEQLVAEVRGIYAGLVMVEAKCIEVDGAQQKADSATRLCNEQWQALIALHRTLLHEHHDFFLASQHPSASPALRRLAMKYVMPARMWRHGIHAFLELLRHRLPSSLEHMLTFIYLSYSMIALLYETVPAFEDTWIECLGDLGRYRMAIEDDDIRDREVWTTVSRHWYTMASDKAPTTGRLYHHQAILARPNAVQQLNFYAKSLCVPIPFSAAEESVKTLFEPILKGSQARLRLIDYHFVRAHGLLFLRITEDLSPEEKEKERQIRHAQFLISRSKFLADLDSHISRTTRAWLETGSFVALSNCCSMIDYGKHQESEEKEGGRGRQRIYDSVLIHAVYDRRGEPNDRIQFRDTNRSEDALEFAHDTDDIVLSRLGDMNILPYVNVRLSWMVFMAESAAAMKILHPLLNCAAIVQLLNSLIGLKINLERASAPEFPRSEENRDLQRPLPEDWIMRGLLWTETLFPADWFSRELEDDERSLERSSNETARIERVVWLGHRLARLMPCMAYDAEAKRFSLVAGHAKERNPGAGAGDTTLRSQVGGGNSTSASSLSSLLTDTFSAAHGGQRTANVQQTAQGQGESRPSAVVDDDEVLPDADLTA